MDLPPDGAVVASASYAVFGESEARKEATMKALSLLALQKAAKVDIQGEVDSLTIDHGDAVTKNNVLHIQANISGQEIEVSARTQKFWKDQWKQELWILMVEQ